MYKIQTVYLPTSDSNVELQVGRLDNRDYYKSFEKVRDVYEEERFVFTPEQLNEYTQNVIKQALETAAKEVKIEMKPGMDYYYEDYIEGIDKESITNTFEETFKFFKI